eukprot:m.122680 g.122680  ORF g.122680 m.122680 type:complete len:282 (-) comp13431_c0_seq4:1698-2543(-)
MAGRILGITRSILRAEPPSKRATFRAIEPSRQWLDRIEKMEVGRRRKQRMPKQRGIPTAATDGVPAMFRRMKRVCTATTVPQLPPERLPEIAVCGRSNVGKSSLLNALTASSPTKVSPKPGETQSLDFYSLGPGKATVVDMPGYGFAYAKEEKITSWLDLMRVYLSSRQTLRRLYILLDARHGVKQIDANFMEHLDRTAGPRYTCVLTKCDLVPPADLARQAQLLEEAMRLSVRGTSEPLLVSTRSELSVQALRQNIERVVGGGGPSSSLHTPKTTPHGED